MHTSQRTSCMHTSQHTQGTVTEQKNELMFTRFGVNYNTLPEQFRKVCKGRVLRGVGACMMSVVSVVVLIHSARAAYTDVHPTQGTVLVWQQVVVPKTTREGGVVEKRKRVLQPLHVDIIRDGFWNQHPHVLAD